MFQFVATLAYILLGCIQTGADVAGVNPRSTTFDDAKAKVEELRQIVLAEILDAHSNLETLREATLEYGTNVAARGQLLIGEQSVRFDGYLETVKLLEIHAQVDVDICLIPDEATLLGLPEIFLDNINFCIFKTNEETNTAIDDAMYIVDVQYTRVHELDNQLNLCSDGNASCIDPVVALVENDLVALPQKIFDELNKASGTIETLKGSLDYCEASNVAQYTTEAGALITKMASCIDSL